VLTLCKRVIFSNLKKKGMLSLNHYIGTAVVTGGSKGIGRAIAMSLANEGYRVAIFDVLQKEGREVAEEIESLGGSALFLQVDVSSEEQVLNGASEVSKHFGTASLLVNNAGIFPRGSALDISYEAWLRVIHINLGGAFLCSRAFVPGMLENGSGTIINISSGRALQGAVKGSHYAASKAGIISLTRSLSQEWAPTIRVNAIIPGITDTDQPREDIKSNEELYAIGNSIPLGRIGQPEDIADAVCFLAGEKAAFITGQSLCVNGGAILQ
jgi:3-oxoacyl-[acyl-carrier protein] reductase